MRLASLEKVKNPTVSSYFMMVMVETLVDGLVSDLTDAQLQDAASIFANEMKTVVIARYKMNLADRKEEFTGKEAAFLSKLFNL